MCPWATCGRREILQIPDMIWLNLGDPDLIWLNLGEDGRESRPYQNHIRRRLAVHARPLDVVDLLDEAVEAVGHLLRRPAAVLVLVRGVELDT